MEGLSAPFADMTDTVLIIGEARLPVHRAILAANSAVFADMFIAAGRDESASSSYKMEVLLHGDKPQDVHTALTYIYRGCTVCRASPPELMSIDDTQSLIRFAHKYDIKDLLDVCEAYMVELVKADLVTAAARDYKLFKTNQCLVSWTALAEECNLDTLQAHCELFMINDSDEKLWCHPATCSEQLSRRCLQRMLHAMQSNRFSCGGFRGGANFVSDQVDVTTLIQWKRD